MPPLSILLLIVALFITCVWLLRRGLPRLMLPEQRSAYGLEETVKRLTDSALAAGWVVQSVVELEKSIAKNGGGTVRPVRLVNICQAKHAARIMNDDTARRVSVLMPCTISVYEKSDGSVWVGAMNPGLIAPLFGGVVAAVMGGPVAREQESFLAAVRQK
ncbi:MAG: DUF302 domain-containing protein [Opitutae bacterium]|nr:DUF302 domain-containing protein [Opitutae bacterium]